MNLSTTLLLAAAAVLLPGLGLVLLGIHVLRNANWITGPVI